MLKSTIAACAFVMLLAASAHAQPTMVYSFSTCPYNLVVSQTKIFATLGANGGNNPIFEYDTVTGAGNTIYTLPGEGRLVAAAKGLLYGWVSNGTSTTLFSFNPDTNAYQSLHVFPKGAPTTLIYHKGVLYGTDDNGGATGAGTVFRYDIRTRRFRTLYEFSGGTTDGNDPATAPVYSGGYLYVVGSSAVLKLQASDGKVVWDSPFTYDQGGFGVLLALRHGTLFGANQSYGANDAGTIFSADPMTGAISLVYTFNTAIGSGASLFRGETLYGTYGGIQQQGGGVFTYAVPSGTLSEPYSFPAVTNPLGVAVAVGSVGYVATGTMAGTDGYCSLYSFPL